MTVVSNPVRLAFASATVFAVTGMHLPYWPVWLEAQGITPAGISALVALGYFTRMVAAPGLSYFADAIGDRRAPLIWLAALHLVGLGAFWLAEGFLAIAAITIVASGSYAAIIPLKESLTMGWVIAKDYDYGRIRLWGSLAFIVMSVTGGLLLSPFGADAILVALMVLAGVMIAAGFALPPDPRKGEQGTRARVNARAVGALLRQPAFILFMISASAVMASHAVYYAFGTINWQRLDYSNGFIGALWGLGVFAEIVLFAFSAAFVRKLTAPQLLMLGALAAVVRWTWTAFNPHWIILILLQCLHAATFGATHLGVMHYIARAVPSELAATAQGIFGAIGGGVVMGLVMLSAGPLYSGLAAYAYLPMAGLGLVGLAAAYLLQKRWRTTGI